MMVARQEVARPHSFSYGSACIASREDAKVNHGRAQWRMLGGDDTGVCLNIHFFVAAPSSARTWLFCVQQDSRIQDAVPLFVDANRIQIDFLDLRIPRCQL